MGLLSRAGGGSLPGALREVLMQNLGGQQPQQPGPQGPQAAPLPEWFNNPAMMGGQMPMGTPPINPMGGPGGQAPMQGQPFQWRGVMPRGYGG